MQARIDDGKPFRLKDLTAISRSMINKQVIVDDGAYSPINRIAEKLCRKNQKAGRIWFQTGWWRRVGNIP